MEGLLPKLYGDDAVEIPGARSLLKDLMANSVPWTIVTSGTIPLVTGVRKTNNTMSLSLSLSLPGIQSIKSR